MNKINFINLLKITLSIFFLVTSPAILAQEQQELSLNEDFLNSLPDEAREALVNQLREDQSEIKSLDYGAYSTMIDSNSAEKYIQQELIDDADTTEPQFLTRESLTLFGSNFFTGFPTSFMPISEPSLSSDYILDFGDKVIVEIYGTEADSDMHVVTADGSISIPSFGKLQIAGLSLNQAQIKVSQFVKSKATGSSASISLETIRDIQIVVVGFASVPGIYTVSGNSSVLSALKVAGGIADGGSYRNIVIKRKGKIVGSFDLYDLLLRGDLSMNLSLKAGDVLLVQPSKEVIAVYGGVKKPALFELKNENIDDLLNYAGNSIDGYIVNAITHSSLMGNNLNAVQIVSKDFASTQLKGGDEIYVPFASKAYTNSVRFIGASSKPGVYSVDAANMFLQSDDFFSPNAYKLAVVHKSFAESSNKFFYNLHNPTNSLKLNPGDELIVIDYDVLNFLNSKTFREFILSDATSINSDCKYVDYINNARASSRFSLISSLLEQFSAESNFDNNVRQNNDSNIDPSLKPREVQQIKLDLFLQSDAPEICIRMLDDDPELLINLLRNAILVEGKNTKSGIYPIAKSTPARTILDAVMLQREFKSDSKVSLTNNLTTSFHTLEALSNKTISPGMNLSISSQEIIIGGQVTITGEVNKPGTYFISAQDRLSSIIELAGGFKDSAYPLGGVLIRKSARELERAFNKNLYNDTIRALSSQLVQGENIPFQSVSFVLNEFMSIEPSGRVITEFNETLLRTDVSSDLILEAQDTIHIPKRSNIVYVFGEVLRPGPQNYNSSSSVKDFIKRSGGFTSSVDKSAVILVYPNGETKLIKFGIFPGNDIILPGSVIYATRDFKKLNNMKLASTLAPIVSSIAISLASLNSISND